MALWDIDTQQQGVNRQQQIVNGHLRHAIWALYYVMTITV